MNVGLVKGRHEMPVTEFIFDSIPDVTNFVWMEDVARYKLIRLFPEIRIEPLKSRLDPAKDIKRDGYLNLYVTGLTAALVAVLNVCYQEGISVQLWHYDLNSSQYIPQVTYNRFEVEV